MAAASCGAMPTRISYEFRSRFGVFEMHFKHIFVRLRSMIARPQRRKLNASRASVQRDAHCWASGRQLFAQNKTKRNTRPKKYDLSSPRIGGAAAQSEKNDFLRLLLAGFVRRCVPAQCALFAVFFAFDFGQTISIVGRVCWLGH